MEDSRSQALAAESWFEQTVFEDIQHCDADLARAATAIVPHFTSRGALMGIVRIQRFRDTALPEQVRLALLHDWLNALAAMYGDQRAEDAKVYGPVLTALERDDPSLLVRKAVPLYRDMLANSGCCGRIHWPNDRPHPMFVTGAGQTGNRQDPLLQIYEPDEAWPLPAPHEGTVHTGSCPVSN